VSDFLTTQPVVDFVELTPRLLFLTKWARGVTQTADWQQTPLTTLGLDGRGQVRAGAAGACVAWLGLVCHYCVLECAHRMSTSLLLPTSAD
jgi:hypothetical protein